MKRAAIFGAACLAAACGPYPPKTYPTPEPVPIQAAYDVTWDAVVDHFAETLVPIATIEKASGIIVTAPHNVAAVRHGDLADCWTDMFGNPGASTLVRYNVRVKGDSFGSQVRVTALYVDKDAQLCNSKGTYERTLMSLIKTQAEADASSARPRGAPQPNPALTTPARRDSVPPRATVPPASVSSSDALFVGSRVDQVYYRIDCVAAQEIAPGNRRYFRTEQDAIAAAYRRSRIPGC